MVVAVVVLEVQAEAAEDFRRFESAAARIMEGHGGRIERTVVTEPEPESDVFKEIHIVRFPSKAALGAYRKDSRLSEIAALKTRAVVSTRVWIGRDGPNYHG